MAEYHFFLTGTDTEIGKTTLSCGILAKARQQGYSTLGIKPVASGCMQTPQGLRNEDALALQQVSSVTLAYEAINPVAFEPAIAPHIAAQEAGVTLTAASLQNALQTALTTQAGLTLIEGAGGWRVPLNAHEYLSDLAKSLMFPVILVVGVRLGCVSQAILAKEAIERDGLVLAGWVANLIAPNTDRLLENLQTLQAQLKVPCLGQVPFLAEPTADQVAYYLDINPLLELSA